MTILKRGSIGFNVLRLRLRLDLSPSIYFDDETTEAVMKFQKDHKSGRPEISRIAITREMDRSAAALFQGTFRASLMN